MLREASYQLKKVVSKNFYEGQLLLQNQILDICLRKLLYTMGEKIPSQKTVVITWIGKSIFILWVRLWLYTSVISSTFCVLSATYIFTKDVPSMWTIHCSLSFKAKWVFSRQKLKKSQEKTVLGLIKVSHNQKLMNLLLLAWPIIVLQLQSVMGQHKCLPFATLHCSGKYLDTTQRDRGLTVKL